MNIICNSYSISDKSLVTNLMDCVLPLSLFEREFSNDFVIKFRDENFQKLIDLSLNEKETSQRLLKIKELKNKHQLYQKAKNKLYEDIMKNEGKGEFNTDSILYIISTYNTESDSVDMIEDVFKLESALNDLKHFLSNYNDMLKAEYEIAISSQKNRLLEYQTPEYIFTDNQITINHSIGKFLINDEKLDNLKIKVKSYLDEKLDNYLEKIETKTILKENEFEDLFNSLIELDSSNWKLNDINNKKDSLNIMFKLKKLLPLIE